jgi:hypothetical protein
MFCYEEFCWCCHALAVHVLPLWGVCWCRGVVLGSRYQVLRAGSPAAPAGEKRAVMRLCVVLALECVCACVARHQHCLCGAWFQCLLVYPVRRHCRICHTLASSKYSLQSVARLACTSTAYVNPLLLLLLLLLFCCCSWHEPSCTAELPACLTR